MGFTIEHVWSVSFEPCVGWPKESEYDGSMHLRVRIPVVNGHFQSSLTGEMKLDNFTGYAIVEYTQERCTGCPEDRKADRKATLINVQKVLNAFAKYKESTVESCEYWVWEKNNPRSFIRQNPNKQCHKCKSCGNYADYVAMKFTGELD